MKTTTVPVRPDEPDDYASPHLLMKRGRWSLWKEPEGSSFWHQCNPNKEEVTVWVPTSTNATELQFVLYSVGYTRWDQRGRLVKPAWRCEMCGRKPPESILGTYLIHNFDNISEETRLYK